LAERRRKAGALQLTFMIYGACCAGAFGLEPMVSLSGPGLALLTLLIMPFLWSIPVALACAELTAAFPVDGGNYRWSRMALGDFWGFQAGWWNWMSNFATNSVFAVLFADYLKYWIPGLGPLGHWAVAAALIWAMSCLNLLGIRVVGNSAILMSSLLLVPFVAVVVLGFGQIDRNPFLPLVAPGKSLLSAFGASAMLAIWLYSGYDKLSTAAEEVESPQLAFPRALIAVAVMTVASYVIPTAAGLASVGRWEQWGEGYFSTLAGALGGPWLGSAMTVAALLSNALLLNVTLLSSSRLPFAMAEDRLLPTFLSRVHPRYGTPHLSLGLQAVVLSILAPLGFAQLVIVYSWLQMAVYILIFVNLWKMRATRPELPRPFRVPGKRIGLVLAVFPPIALALGAMAGTIVQEGRLDWTQTAIGAAALLSGPLGYFLMRATVRSPA
jgi:amino acid transporter